MCCRKDICPTSGVLDAETVWGFVLKEQFGFRMGCPDACDLLAWTMKLTIPVGIWALGQGSNRNSRTATTVGGLSGKPLDCLDAGFGEDAVPIEMFCQVVFNAAAETPIKAEFYSAAIRMERFIGVVH